MLKTQSYVVRGAVLAGAIAASTVTAAPAFANPPAPTKTYNSATVNINGGNANALAACVNYAKITAKHSKVAQNNFCKNFAKASGGSVLLKNTDILISQSGTGSGTTVNKATVSISGGDATALAACVNYLQGTATATQTNVCKNTAVATGGDVVLKNSSITVIQG